MRYSISSPISLRMFSNYEIIAAELSLSTARDGEVLKTYLNKHAEASLRCLSV
ncbi:hypothetical protein VAE151_630448 [Vibrio aestuarianus]|uniref:Uncharacterized protein n=1 Tax=Vibrio aestuarianus TaxID=28171 RepID=A0ABM9FIF2_9VIBR|nr:hypothetical protein VAE063_1000446 [Vibrio aestuarianus]CAH8223409.1 hypothetical protein VIBAE_B10534 [Vibrio aestuarianus subsp. francensis]CAH8220305.1 hypothetical protein VAE308_1150395 [Vibrio aestuarianus]CAH8225031.1 hypothetical protein VAE032_320445 [Vibrio aestuarianus]CAH8225052.1 hypothetical protein VAE055_420449 [Vibrio aestuarianus]